MPRRSLLPITLMLVILATFMVAACGGQVQSSGGTSPVSEDKGQTAPDFSITVYQGDEVLGGEEVRFSDLLGQGKPVVLNMWAGLCPPCRIEMPDLQAVHEEYQDRVLLFGLDVGPFVRLGTREDGQALLEELKVTYPAGTTFEANVVRDYKVLGMPSTYFIKANGEIVRTWAGLLTEEKLVELVEELLAS